MTADRIRHVALSSVVLPLPTPISDAKVLTGRQRPMTEVVLLSAEVATLSDQAKGWTVDTFEVGRA